MKIKSHILFCYCGFFYAINCSTQSISCGFQHSIAKCTDNSVMAWGQNTSGGIGDNTTTDRSSPAQVHGVGNVGFLSSIIAVGAGRDFSLAIKNDNTLWAWGNNSKGQLGNNTFTSSSTPVQVLTGASGCATYLCNVTAVSGGDFHTLALKNDNTVWAWGDNGSIGKLGINVTTVGSTRKTPVQVTRSRRHWHS